MSTGLLTPVLAIGIIVYLFSSYYIGYRRAFITISPLIVIHLLDYASQVAYGEHLPYISLVFYTACSITYMVSLYDFSPSKEKFYMSLLLPFIVIYTVDEQMGLFVIILVASAFSLLLFKLILVFDRNLSFKVLVLSVAIIVITILLNEPQDAVLVAFEAPIYIKIAKSYECGIVRIISEEPDILDADDVGRILLFVSELEKISHLKISAIITNNKMYLLQRYVVYGLLHSHNMFLRLLMERPKKL